MIAAVFAFGLLYLVVTPTSRACRMVKHIHDAEIYADLEIVRFAMLTAQRSATNLVASRVYCDCYSYYCYEC